MPPAMLSFVGVGNTRALRPTIGAPVFPLARTVSLSRVRVAPGTTAAAQMPIDIGDVAATVVDINGRALPASVYAAAIGEQCVAAHGNLPAAFEIRALRPGCA